MTESDWSAATRNWVTTLMFGLTALVAAVAVPWYGLAHGYSGADWAWFAIVLCANGLSITCGYHRLFAHATYEARPALKLFYLLFGAMALQNSVLVWAAGHRVHHRYIDDTERDPYCARRGFWFSHIGWMLHNYPSGEPDFSTVRELQADPLVAWQHRHYLTIALAMNFGVPLLLGLATGDVLGCLLLAGLLRLVVSHHVTFFINSLAHMFGTRPYTEDNTARDNPVVALLTFGEGYHNFHHMFAHDYRNGVRWWQWDPSKWFINLMRWAGLAYGLKSVPWFRIQRARLETQFRRAEAALERRPDRATLGHLRARMAEEYAAFTSAVQAWTQLREQWLQSTRQAVADRWERSILQSRLRELERALGTQQRRLRLLCAQLG
ncbi:MAG: fatty acid desaturase [Proteobacteria bacterium]|nr:fatty acid desaturase [Pseudomonadota bacterium]